MGFERVLLEHLLPCFGSRLNRAGTDASGPPCTPWWWPQGDGSDRVHWFGELSKSDVESAANRESAGKASWLSEGDLLADLRRRPSRSHPDLAYREFSGSFGQYVVRGTAVMLISDRPSHSHYWAGPCTTLVSALRRAHLGAVPVTDIIKVRGERSSEDLPAGESLRGHGQILEVQLQEVMKSPGVERLHLIPVQSRSKSLLARALPLERLPVGVSVASRPVPFWGNGWTLEFIDELQERVAGLP